MGAWLVSSASQKVLSATCEISTIMPRRFISCTTSLPKGERPLLGLLAMSPEESAQWLLLVWVRVI